MAIVKKKIKMVNLFRVVNDARQIICNMNLEESPNFTNPKVFFNDIKFESKLLFLHKKVKNK